MTADLAALLDGLAAADVRLEVVGGRLGFDAPAGALTDELRARIVAHRDSLLTYLEPSPPRPRSCARCGVRHPIMLAMEPGADGEPWFLCPRCWRG